MTANQILIGVGLILVLAVGFQVLASRGHLPAGTQFQVVGTDPR